MFGRKKHVELCSACDRALKGEEKICACGAATRHMDFAERTAYEVEQWRRTHNRTAAAS